MREISVDVCLTIEVGLDETKFTPEFMEDFRNHFYDFNTIEDHAKHLAQMYARGLITEYSEFIEGYGPPKELGIIFDVAAQEESVN